MPFEVDDSFAYDDDCVFLSFVNFADFVLDFLIVDRAFWDEDHVGLSVCGADADVA